MGQHNIENDSHSGNVCTHLGFYLTQSAREIKTRKCSYIWGFLSVMLVCCITSVVLSVSEKFPVVVLMLSEGSAGEIDMSIKVGENTDRFGINATEVERTVSNLGEKFLKIFSYNRPERTYLTHFLAINTERERSIEIGREWTAKAIPKGETIITASLARLLNLHIGDILTVPFPVTEATPIAASIVLSKLPDALPFMMDLLKEVNISFRINDIVDDALGKIEEEEVMFVELETLWDKIVDSFPSEALITIHDSQWKNANISEFVSEVVFSCEVPRHPIYLTFDTRNLKKKLVSWASRITYALSFDDLDITMPVPEAYTLWSMLGMLINMVSMLIVVVLVGISILLIYSLLQISVDTRTFELGILRMVGLNRLGIAGTLVAQALMYSLPGWIIGIGLGYLVNWIVVGVLARVSSVALDPLMPAVPIVVSSLISFGISLIASIFPIRSALTQNLHDSIDVNHSKTKVVMVSIERASDLSTPWGYLVAGLLLAGIGGSVYITFPQALLAMNTTLIAFLLFFMLLLILLSLVLICMNFEYILETIVATVFLFWEKRAVREIAVKNLGAHRLRNRKTTILYAVSLAFIVFANIMLTIAVDQIETMVFMDHGCDIHLRAYKFESVMKGSAGRSQSRYDPDARYLKDPEMLEAIVDKYSDIVASIAWVTHEMETVYNQAIRTQIANQGRSHAFYHHVYGTTPNFMDNLDHKYVKVIDEEKSGDSVIKALYTDRNNPYSTVLSGGIRKAMDAKPGDVLMMNIIPATESSDDGGSALSFGDASEFLDFSLARINITATAYLEAIPFFNFPSQTISKTDEADVPLSIPAYLTMIPGNSGHLDNIKYNHLLIRFKEGATESQMSRVQALYDELKAVIDDPGDNESTYKVWTLFNALDGFVLASDILNITFYAVTVLVMILCFFSLMSSMHTNVLEQAKEIGIMRALGLTRFQLVRVYVEEAFVLVLTATVMGMISGMVVGYLIISQMGSLQGLPTPMYFPWQLVLVMIAMAVVTSILSALEPTLSTMKKSIVSIIKTH
ncbi:putative efflux ABC transporter, permease domain containing protein [Monocercomonoides exilis]|uniref:putative efflux ABC transporter, permease domain containing protein n=1 Tax=Monocercomonoides exilis TaxID=2049356 RepID=UPI00355A2CDB|nr:putative efflux ABC transporter, permease domain containing protein [Monocercomonoides exilis]|eukprot:MONOS_5566.1-p1 / transcript=MONOS_5566.1 / gene=MONOS_5566 / organism=Monocercomonoides_exilis_PA203 / gene_product=efflux ABC transporter, permease domain containing protein / transcript_product=efflux ABC transporter, permease domain containing protein / location=Mono_scaffold00163:84302-88173(+) / protein_length=1027 / sequence_SO=supercontig / SO=protein_coding / is_pseudo=false